MPDPFKTNPHKAASKIEINNTLMAVCLTVFGIIWAFAPERLDNVVLVQFIFAIPLLYISSISYTKIAYWKEVRLWNYFGWFTGTTAKAFVLNIIGVLIFLLGHPGFSIMYFIVTWIFLGIYTLINLHFDPKRLKEKIFKFLYFVLIQFFFGILVLYL